MIELLKTLRERRRMFPWSLACTVSNSEMDTIIAVLEALEAGRAVVADYLYGCGDYESTLMEAFKAKLEAAGL